MLIQMKQPYGVSSPPPAPPPTDTLAPTVPTGLVANVTYDGSGNPTVHLSCDPGSDPVNASNANSGVLGTQFTKGGVNLGAIASEGGAGPANLWTSLDLGGAGGGATVRNGADFDISSSGTGFYDSPDSGRFVYTSLTGDFWFAAQLTAWSATDTFAKAELMARLNLTDTSPFIADVHFPFAGGNGQNGEARLINGGAGSQGNRVAGATSPAWLGMLRVGLSYSIYYSYDGNTWVPLAQFNAPAIFPYIGLAVAKGALGAGPVTASFRNVNLTNLSRPTRDDTAVIVGGTYTYRAFRRDLATPANDSVTGPALAFTVPAIVTGVQGPYSGYFRGGAWNLDTSTSDRIRLAQVKFNLLDYYPGSPGVAAAMADIKTRSGGATKIWIYANNEGGDKAFTPAYITAQNWTCRLQYPAGAQVESYFSTDQWMWNNTIGCHRDGSGKNLQQWFANYTIDWKVNPGSGVGGPVNIDGIMLDNFFWKPRPNADFLEQGFTQNSGDATVISAQQQGYIQGVAEWRANANFAGKGIGGNIDWESIVGYNDLLDMIMNEAPFGEPWSASNQAGGGYAGWLNFLSAYRNRYAALKTTGRRTLFSNLRIDNKTAYQQWRYFSCSMMMGVGYHGPDPHDTGTGSADDRMPFFHEWDYNYGMLQTPPSAAYQLNVWRADWDNVIALVNPSGNGTRTVTLGGNFWLLRGVGTTPAGYVEGQMVNSMTLTEANGVVLSRTVT